MLYLRRSSLARQYDFGQVFYLENMLAIINGIILTGSGETLTGGTVLVKEGKILSVGAVDIPSEAQVMDATAKFVTPGMLDAHTHLGISEGGGWEGLDSNERTDPITPHLRAIDAINPADDAIQSALQHGITCVVVTPGSGNVIGGTCVVVKTSGDIADRMIVREPAGLKAALGENPKRTYAPQRKSPMTRMGSAGLLRNAFTSAQNYLKRQKAAESEKQPPPDRDLKMETLCKVLRKEIPLRVHAHRADDIITALRIADEFDIDIILEHGTEAHHVADHIRKRNVPVVVGPALSSPSKIETKDRTFDTVPRLLEMGIKVALTTDHPIVHISHLQTTAVRFIKSGVSADDAFAMITRFPAEICGIADRVGTLEPGKDADIVIWSGHPMEFMSSVESVVVNGSLVYTNGTN